MMRDEPRSVESSMNLSPYSSPVRLPREEVDNDQGEERDGDRLTCHFDGSATPNPGMMGFGWVIERYTDGEIDASGVKGSNNEAEYSALIMLLATLRDTELSSYLSPSPHRGPDARVVSRVTIIGDSQLVIYQMSGKYRAKEKAIIPYYLTARFIADVLEKEKHVSLAYRWVGRDENGVADRLSSPLSSPRSPSGTRVLDTVKRWREMMRVGTVIL
jgi:ribonuclease HI